MHISYFIQLIQQFRYEFEILEQKVEHEVTVKELQEKIENLKEMHRKEMQEINQSRIFEEQLLMQQMDAANKKAKSDREAAKEREKSLQQIADELKTKLEEPDEEKQQLEKQLAELSSRIEELTQKAVNVDAMQQNSAEHQDRVHEFENFKLENSAQLTNARQEIEELQRKTTEMEKKVQEANEEVERVRQELCSSTKLDDLKAEHEVVRTMLMNEITLLE